MVCHRDEVERMESLECLVMPIGLVDIVMWVSMEERPCVVELDKEALVEEMTVVQVENVDWNEVPVERLDEIP